MTRFERFKLSPVIWLVPLLFILSIVLFVFGGLASDQSAAQVDYVIAAMVSLFISLGLGAVLDPLPKGYTIAIENKIVDVGWEDIDRRVMTAIYAAAERPPSPNKKIIWQGTFYDRQLNAQPGGEYKTKKEAIAALVRQARSHNSNQKATQKIEAAREIHLAAPIIRAYAGANAEKLELQHRIKELEQELELAS